MFMMVSYVEEMIVKKPCKCAAKMDHLSICSLVMVFLFKDGKEGIGRMGACLALTTNLYFALTVTAIEMNMYHQ